MQVISDTKVPIKIWSSQIEVEAEIQLRNLAELPFIYKHIAVMPDVHAGRGSTIGTVIATEGAIIPAAVGVDIGCGMAAIKLPFKIDILTNLSQLRHSIERSIPTGHNIVRTPSKNSEVNFKELGSISETAQQYTNDKLLNKALHSLGTLGGGNHFIEICYDQNNDAWLMLHSGSRNIGKHLADIHINKAKDLMKQYFINTPDVDLAYLAQGTKEFKEYLHDLMWAQQFASCNREEMIRQALRAISFHVYNDDRLALDSSLEVINCHHNYTAIENHFGKNVYITRKGAVSAKEGQLGIIPGSMSTGSFIVEGLGNRESFCSCSHGAGRSMSRSKARQLFTRQDLVESLKGIEARTDHTLIDEIQYAYKDINNVMENQKDLVKPLYNLKQILNVKGD
jgi:tRNA-splicing ligase RtcB